VVYAGGGLTGGGPMSKSRSAQDAHFVGWISSVLEKSEEEVGHKKSGGRKGKSPEKLEFEPDGTISGFRSCNGEVRQRADRNKDRTGFEDQENGEKKIAGGRGSKDK